MAISRTSLLEGRVIVGGHARLSTTLCFLLVLIAAEPLAAVELVVMSSTAPELEVGALIDGDAPISIAVGSKVTLVSSSGKVVELTGPFEGAPGPAARGSSEPGLLDALAQLVQPEQTEAAAGTFRGAEMGDPPLSQIDPSRSGHVCVPEDQTPVFWRSDSDGEQVLRIRHTKSGSRAETRWSPGEQTAPWPDELPVEDGASYVVNRQGQIAARGLTLHLLPNDLPSDTHRIVWLARHDCLRDARLLLAAPVTAE